MNWLGWLWITTILIAMPAAAQDADRAQAPRASSAAEWQRQIPDIRRRMELVMGPLPGADRRVALEVEVVDEERTDRYLRRKLRYSPEAGDRVPAWLLIPHTATATTPAAAMLCLHQTNNVGKDEPAGLGGLPNLHDAHELAERGFVCLVPDYPSFGEYAYDFQTPDRGYASGSMKAVWNNLRGVDLLASLPEVIGTRIGVIGHSLGGHNAIFTAAFDDRLVAVVSSCGFTPFPDYDSGDVKGWTSDRYMPRIRDTYALDAGRIPFDFPEVIASFAPRSFFSNSPVGDDNFAVAGVRRAFAEARPVHRLFDGTPGVAPASARLIVVTPACGHDFPPEIRRQAYDWLEHRLSGPR
ncbi:MAG: Cephalosporin-C deacetylase [Planctomycetota bacterium]|jgi:acetyl esterase/lipase